MKYLFFVVALGLVSVGQSPTAEAQSQTAGTDIELTVTVNKPVMQDMLVAWLYFRVEGPEADGVQQKLNTQMAAAWKVATCDPAVEARIDGYRVWYDDGTRGTRRDRREGIAPKPVPPKWIAHQSIRLKTTENDAALKGLVDKLQAMGLALNYFDYGLSPALHENATQELMQPAAEKLLSKARQLARAFGSDLSALKEVNIGGRQDRYAEVSSALAYSRADDERVAPVAEPEEEEVYFSLGGLAVMTRVDLKK